jgi:hypothetical protein
VTSLNKIHWSITITEIIHVTCIKLTTKINPMFLRYSMTDSFLRDAEDWFKNRFVLRE